jgi:hypothetical protein
MAKSRDSKPLTHERLKELLRYEPLTGEFFWIARGPGRRLAGRAGTIAADGYRRIVIDYVSYVSSHLAWLYVRGEWPSELIDHENLDKSDDRFENLRPASPCQNMQNFGITKRNTSGFKGVSWFSGRPKGWRASISCNGQTYRLGIFQTKDAAAKAYADAATKLHGEFARLA